MRETLFLEHRFAAPGEDGAITGVALPFNVVDTYRTSFDRRAFGDLSGRTVPMLWAHRQDEVLGSWNALETADTELRATGRLNLEVARAREVRAMIAAGDVRGLSVSFERLRDESRANGVRHITQARLIEISLVALPSVPGARVTSIRSGRPSAAADFIEAVKSATRALS
jgi:hypothetical protein